MNARAMGIAALVACMSGHAHAAAGAAAEIVSLDGKGEFRELQRNDWRPAALRQPLYPTNFVRTGDLSRMAILFEDRTQVRLAPNSTLQIKEAASATDTKTTLRLNAGRSWVQSKNAPNGLNMETPSALAAIRGTDWEMAVDDDGKSTLSVFSGEVELSNDQGRVVVRPSEQAVAEKGKAPVKLQLRVSRTRVQWVSSYSVDPARYQPLARNVADLVKQGRLAEAQAAARADPSAVGYLLAADFDIYAGDLPAARATLEKAARAHPDDPRIASALARVASFADDSQRALDIARDNAARHGDSAEAWITLGDIERLEGHAPEASAAYARAMQLAAQDARGFAGAGVVESERENVRAGRGLLQRAIDLDSTQASYRAELGTLESFAGNRAAARASLDKAVQLQPDNYVAWTGLGILALKEGRTQEALDALLRATLIEPRYARAHLYIAAAYYAQERSVPALASLARAAEEDPRDPLPYLLASIIYLDRIDPVAAAAQAQEALKRIPNLKSVNQVADNQKGVANVGFPLAQLGLESWSRSTAQESYLPFWGGSHLFLADRYPGDFDKRSELMQGFLTDPLAFGASNRFQSLFLTPGHHATASMRVARSDDIRAWEPALNANGYVISPVPTSYFVEAIDTHIDPRNSPLKAKGTTLTAAFGVRPTHELAGFVYLNRLAIDADIGTPDVLGVFQHIPSSANSRIDGGIRYTPTADASWWLKAGGSREHSVLDETTTIPLSDVSRLLSGSHFETRPGQNDLSLKGTIRSSPEVEYTVGAERARADTPKFLLRDSSLHFNDSPVPPQSLDQSERDHTASVFGYVRWRENNLLGEGGLAWRSYRKERDFHFTQASGSSDASERYSFAGFDPAAGFVLRASPAALVRAACRRWMKPNALDMQMPVAIAGIPVDDQVVLPGGLLRQCQAQLEWTLTPRLFATADAAALSVRNLFSPLDGVLNTRVDVTNLDRLRNRTLSQPGKPDELEDVPVFAAGTIRRAHGAVEAILSPAWAARLHYTYSETENTGETARGASLPYIARHNVNAGLTWSPGYRIFVTAIGTWRSRRFADEANQQLLPAGWDAQLTFFIESANKRWALEAYGANLLKREASDSFGVVLSYRF